jgi:hypothetical protein
MKTGVRALFPALILGFAAAALGQERVLQLPGGEELRYEVIEPGSQSSARPAALALLRHLADGDIEAAAKMSNAPQRRLEVLREFRRSVGEEQFKDLFGRYFAPENRILAEAAIGKHRLLIWDLGEAGNQLAGQYYVEVDGKFVMDDMPNAERSKLQRVLEAYRKQTSR